jgi:hypothetical protein
MSQSVLSQSVLAHGVQDLVSMDKGDVSKNLFGQIQWEELLRSHVILEHREVNIYQHFFFFAILFN